MYPGILFIAALGILSIGIYSLLIAKFYLLRRKIRLPEDQRVRLFALAEKSLESLDVPVGALVMHKGTIIGEGYNTVFRNSKAGEHAEINAISDAISRIGMEQFSSLERDSLILISTFEPCLMCAGACINYNIQNVYFYKRKNLSYLARESGLFVRYSLKKKQTLHGNEQELLFKKHPDYPGINKM